MAEGSDQGSVLIIDDEPDFLKIASVRLTREGGFRVCIANTAENGLNMAKVMHPDVILLDMMMPKIDGHEALRRLKEDENTKDIPVIMLTSVGSDEKIASSLNLGASCHLTKPYNPKELLNEVSLAVAHHKQAHKNIR
jgi:DNA-binding response OmpR family regulator